MRYRREFEIPYVGLKNGVHTMDYEIGEKFFDLLDVDRNDFENVNIKVGLVFDKHPSFFNLKFDISGRVDVPCDRCGDPFPLNLWDEFELLVKLVEPTEEQVEMEDDGDVVFWPKNEPILDVSEWIYEFIMLSIPMQHIHPEDKNGESTCNRENLALLEKMRSHDDEEQADPEEGSNQLWKALEALKSKNNTNNN